MVPQGVAFAIIAGMPPQYGLYAGMVPAIVAALFGSSWHLVSGPTTAASVVLFSALSAYAETGSADLAIRLRQGSTRLNNDAAGAVVDYLTSTTGHRT